MIRPKGYTHKPRIQNLIQSFAFMRNRLEFWKQRLTYHDQHPEVLEDIDIALRAVINIEQKLIQKAKD